MYLKDFLVPDEKSNLYRFRIIPNAKNTEFVWKMDNWVLKVRIASLPEKWKANKCLIDFLSKTLNIKKRNVEIVSWLTEQNKVVKIDFN